MAKSSISSGRGSSIARVALYVVPLLLLLAFGGYYFKKYNDLKNKPVSADQVAQAEVDRTLAEVGKLYDLPQDEKPSVATVTDKEKLKDQPFFARAENGDVTLIYSNAKLAILYRPSTKQIINVSTVTIQDTKPVVAVIGLQADRDAASKVLDDKFAANVTVGSKTEAKGTHSGIVVVDISGQNAELAKQLAEGLGGTVGTLPAGEEKPADAQLLVIAGSAPAAQ